ncbi:BTAD domain-containing putative transcriptional regulator [Actinoplanes sp. NPDC049596]|uniref:AfsR/SARP family transcriptional regulator n=1 Tax=unclassified Actinoplanes TaxID=2626549 RepID=UPI00342E428C
MAKIVRVRVFGGLRLWRDGQEVPVGPVRLRIVLAALLAGRGAVVTTGELVDALWGDGPSASAVNQVQRLIGQVRRLFEPGLRHRETGEWVAPAGDGYRLAIDGRSCDLSAFFELVAAGRAAVEREDLREAAQKYEQALELAVEHPFAGLPAGLVELPAFVAIDGARSEAAVEAADVALAHPRAYRLAPLISRYAAAAPLHEPLQARLIRLMTVTGRRAEALVHFERVRHRLAEELGTDPTVELRAAHLEALADPEDEAGPAQLPLSLTGFTPRDDLTAALEGGRRAAVVVLSGMAGAGKTALAVHWAHRITVDYPDGQLYLNLRGFEADGRQVRPAEALNSLLESIGIDPGAAGGTLEARAARWRSALADRRMILLLDNAHDSAHVRPLLPGSAGCLVVVTSRNRLTGLVAHEGAHPVQVGRLNRASAWDLLSRRLGAGRLAAEPAAADELIRLGAGLPLALAIAAAHIAVRPELPLADVVAELGSAARRLDGLRTGERQDDVRSAFSWSYAALTAPSARLFRLLAVHPAAEIAVAAMASAAGAGVEETLPELYTANMVTQLGAGRYTVHDLLRAYAAELLDASELLAPGDERGPAERRLVEHYLHSTRNAYRTFGLRTPRDLGPAPAGVVPVAPAGTAAALDWYAAERAAVYAVADLAFERGWTGEAALIVLHLRPLRSSSAESHADSQAQILRVLGAVADTGDPVLEIAMRREAAMVLRGPEPGRARSLLTGALDIAEQEDLVLWQAQVHRSLGDWPPVLEPAGRLRHLRRAVELAREAADTSVLVYALQALGQELAESGAATEAAPLLTEAFELAETEGLADLTVGLAILRAEAVMELDDVAGAIRLTEWALGRAAPGDNYSHLVISHRLAIAYARIGDTGRARAAAALYDDLVRRHGDSYAGVFGAEMMRESRREIAAALATLETARA